MIIFWTLFLIVATPVFGSSPLLGPESVSSSGLNGNDIAEASVGQPWPRPQWMKNYGDGFVVIRPALFRFQVTRHTCDILEEALKRYYAIILRSNYLTKIHYNFQSQEEEVRSPSKNKTWKANPEFHGYLDSLRIELLNPCETMPHDEMEEAYTLKIDTPDLPGGGLLASSSNWGILRGLETFVQLMHPMEDFSAVHRPNEFLVAYWEILWDNAEFDLVSQMQLKSTAILDYPRFSFRAVLLDTSRHYLSKKVLYENLDLMAYNKYNVFHWHIVDDQSFPYQSKGFPSISDKGSYHKYTHVYTQNDVRDIIEYARLRGIRVLPEFDTPGHTQSWGLGVPGFLTKCYSKAGHPDGTFGPVDVSNSENYNFLRRFFEEVATVFPEKYLHLGGDEVEHKCWESNPDITAFMDHMNFTSYTELEGYHMQSLIDIVETFPQNNSYLVWQEVFDIGVKLENDTIVHIWKDGDQLPHEIFNVTEAGYRALVYSCWYLNYISYGVDWAKYYTCDPHNFNGTEAQKKLVFGGGAAMWGEYVDTTNLIPRLWPRAAVPAERLWSNANVTDHRDAEKRLEEQRCRLLQRGYNVQPINGPGYCLVSWD